MTNTVDVKLFEHRCHILAAGLAVQWLHLGVLTALVTQRACEGTLTRLNQVFRVRADRHQECPLLQRPLQLADNDHRTSKRFGQTKSICHAVGDFVVKNPGHPQVEVGHSFVQFMEEVFKFTETTTIAYIVTVTAYS